MNDQKTNDDLTESRLSDGLAAADRVLAELHNMTDAELIEALERVEDDSLERAIYGG